MTFRLEKVQTADAADLLAWRNDPTVRALSRHQGEISWAEHCRWLERMRGDPECLFLVAWRDGQRVGVVRFNRRHDKDVWEVSITVAPAAQGQGLGRLVLKAGIDDLRRAHPGAQVLAAVQTGNHASAKLFQGAGFIPVPSDEACAHFLLGA